MGRKIARFVGIAPKVSPELLPDTVAQTAVNVKLYSGDLLPYRDSLDVDSVGRTGDVQTIYPMIDPDTGENVWLSWLTDVDVAIASSTDDDEQRIYYTGDNAPKVTNYALAVDGSNPYPSDSYDLGLPLPTVQPTATATAISAVNISNVKRNGEGITTYTTSAAHGFRSGQRVSVSGFSVVTATYVSTAGSTNDIVVTLSTIAFSVGGDVYLTIKSGNATSGYYSIRAVTATTFTVSAPGTAASSGNVEIDMKPLNVKSAEITVTDSTHFTSYSVGPQFADQTGTFSTVYGTPITVQLSGTELPRDYVYTWITPWGEESVPSDATDTLYVREGQTVTVGTLPTSKPSGDNFVTGIRVYRTVTDTTGSDYFLLRTMWFPNPVASASRTSNVATVTLTVHHAFEVGELIKITGMAFGGTPDTSFNVTDGVILSVVDDYTFTYASTGSNKATTVTTAGTVYSDIAEYDSGTSRYFESTTFVDDYDVGGLAVTLDSLENEPPPAGLTGLKVTADNIMVGFVGNQLYFSFPDKPWAWPSAYALTFDSDIVAVEPSNGAILVLTTTYPYTVQGNSPANMSPSRDDTLMPCISKRSVVNMGYGVQYSTHQGIAVASPGAGAQAITKLIHDWDTWANALDPTTIIAEYYDGKYFASHSGGSFVFERNDQVGGIYVTTPIRFLAAYYDALNRKFYYISDTNGTIREWDALDQLSLPMEWKSKVFVDPEYTSVGAFRVVADFTGVSEENEAITAYNAGVPAFNAAVWADIQQLGTVDGPSDLTDSNAVDVYGTLNALQVNGDPFTQSLMSAIGIAAISFRLWANKVLVHDVTIDSSAIYRLPTTYKSDTLEVAVSGAVRVRAIHLAETPFGLKGV